ncbi:MAG: SDR family oxidoreductase [Rhodoferax sp.]|nr:SDR family oxidoreductase [Rhodoferax sp.]MBP9930353.1 SDR family oxidoreductase [Rhodoferax sp.]HQX59169.1 SDR family oxidoreductase [Burkholderiaceae bacterium]HQZ08325.1 SDR family oxidoreductase [Burkholderiaceae bacterium]HRA63207.1 SDR family oxidoreductase [Burkholderiaceae bacterium]
MDDFKGKAILITGASTGIGAGCAQAFGARGATVAVHYNSSKDAADAVVKAVKASGGDAFVVQGDLRTSAQCAKVVAEAASRMGRIDVLINNAGALVQRQAITELTDALLDDIIDLNVRSMMMCTKFAVPHMAAGTSIINLTSIAASSGGGPGAAMYAGSKAFVTTATKGLAKELVGKGIRINAVSPGVITTPFHDKFSTPEQLEAMRKTIPMARLGSVDECVGAFLYLASEQLASYVTGQVIEVNGGQYMP